MVAVERIDPTGAVAWIDPTGAVAWIDFTPGAAWGLALLAERPDLVPHLAVEG